MRRWAVVLSLCLLLFAPCSSRATDGDLDPSFGGIGVVTIPFLDMVQDAGGIALQSNGMIVVAGRVASAYGALGSLALARYAADGTPDPAFGSGGLVTTALTGDESRNVVVHQDGTLYVLRVGRGDILLSHFSSTGDLDLSFGSGGTVTTDCGGSEGAGVLRNRIDQAQGWNRREGADPSEGAGCVAHAAEPPAGIAAPRPARE